jgi:hypothetical protein
MNNQETGDKKMQVELKASPNPDFDPPEVRATIRIKAFRHTVDSFKDASRAVRHFIESNDLGSGNFTGGLVFDGGRVVGRVSYNGRVWNTAGNEIAI